VSNGLILLGKDRLLFLWAFNKEISTITSAPPELSLKLKLNLFYSNAGPSTAEGKVSV